MIILSGYALTSSLKWNCFVTIDLPSFEDKAGCSNAAKESGRRKSIFLSRCGIAFCGNLFWSVENAIL